MYTKESFYNKCNLIHNNKFTYFNDFNGVDNKIDIKCNICEYENNVYAKNHLKGIGCAKCYGNNKLDNSFLERINNNYIVCIEDLSHKKYLFVYCKECKIVFKQKINNMLNGHIGCICRNISKPVQYIKEYLDNLNVQYIMEYRFKDCRNILPLPFDFYLPDRNICIEYDGEQHFEPKDCFGGIEEFNKVKLRDSIKDEYCKENSIELIRFNSKNLYILKTVII